MKVLHLAPGRKYDVWAMCDEDEFCQVVETLKRVHVEHSDLVETISALLFEEVPKEGPPLHDPLRAKMLYRDILYELKATKTVNRKHLGLRIVFFFDSSLVGGPVVVCTNAFCKSGGATPADALDLALTERSRYFAEKRQMEILWQRQPS